MFSIKSFNVRSAPFIVLITLATSIHASAESSVFKVQIVADDMCCQGCVQKVAAQLYALPGVTSVEAHVPSRVVTVTAKQSQKLTNGRIWQAVEKGKGSPSKLITPTASYVLTRPAGLKPEQRLPTGRYSIQLRSIPDQKSAQSITKQLYSIRGVAKVSADIAKNTLYIQAANGALLSPFGLAAAVEQANAEAVAIGGPDGVMSIERPTDTSTPTALNLSHTQIQGDVR
jgi:copper chaperone CopZ